MNEQTVKIVDPRDEERRARFEQTKARMRGLLPEARIDHIGSTADCGEPLHLEKRPNDGR